jgi:methyltransferase (TIGR00027 family)
LRAGEPSQTARGAAAYRAIHQTLDGGTIFRDPVPLRILDDATRATLDEIAANPSLRPSRLFIAARSRFSEDILAASVARGARQIVVLGAGLDTFSLRNPHEGEGVRAYEVDYPATQGWKRERLKEAGLAIPASLIFAPVDFERQSLADGLAAAGFRADRPAFFQWLGVVPYLTRETISVTLDFIAAGRNRKSCSTTPSRLKIIRPSAGRTSWLPSPRPPPGANRGSAFSIRPN